MARLRAVILGSAVAGSSLLVASAAIGILYLLRAPTASWPGPKVIDALPLDELPGHDAVNIFLFVLVWASAAAILGALCRSLGVERLTAAIVLGVAMGAFVYGLTGLSLYIVRGLSRHQILHVPTHVRAAYVPAYFAGVAGALIGKPRRRAQVGRPWVLAMFVGAAGLLDVVSAVTPEINERLKLVRRFAPGPLPPLARALVVPIGLVLLLTARGLARRKRRAWELAVALLAGSSVLHLAKGLDFEEATITALLALALFARRHEFTVRGDPHVSSRLIIGAVLLGAAIYAYGAVALWVNQELADRPYSTGFALHETSRALVGLTLTGSPHVHGSFGEWFPLSVFLMGAVAVGWLVVSWLAPWRYKLRQEARSREVTASLVRRWGADTLAPFVLRRDKSYFFGHQESCVLAYTVVGGVVVVSGDPIGPVDSLGSSFGGFLDFAHRRDWRVAILGASERCLSVYEAYGLRSMYHGEEAVIETASFSLDGRRIRKVRQAVHRLERSGYSAELRWAKDVDSDLRSNLEAILAEWRGEEPQKGFAMTLDSPFRLDGQDAAFAVGRDAAGRPHGFLHLVACPAGGALSLSSMPKRTATPNGFNEWLICEAVKWGRERGFGRLSLNFAPFAAILDPKAPLHGVQRLQRDALLAVKDRLHLQLDNLLMFCGQFQPAWQKRFVVYERRSDLPRVVIAALRAEGYLPFGAPRSAER